MKIRIADDFDPDKIARSGQCFRWEKEGEHTYRIIAGGLCLYISSLGECWFELDCTQAEFEDFWQGYFDLDEDYREIRGRIDQIQDPFLWLAAEHEKGIRILRQDPWETLITFIISQNRNIPAIERSVRLLAETCGERKKDKRGRIYYAFPEPAAVASLSEEALKDCRIGYRCKYVRAAAGDVAEGTVRLEELFSADEAETISTLTGIFGVGTKVANCVSLFGLHHVNAFPIDVWISRVLTQEYPNGYPFERYAPYNGIFQQYMFAYYRNHGAGTSK